MNNKLIGELIGLARCTDGNEHLITPSATTLLIDALSAVQTEEASTAQLLVRIEEEKRKMVPDCFLCASPCGKNSAYRMELLQEDPSEIWVLKELLLCGIQRLAAHFSKFDKRILTGCDWECFLYKALIVIGLDGLTEDRMQLVICELNNILKKYDIN